MFIGNKNSLWGKKPLNYDKVVLDLNFNNSVIEDTGNFTPTSTGLTYTNGLVSGLPNKAAVWNSNSDNIKIADDDLLSFGNGVKDDPFKVSFRFKPKNLGVIENSYYFKFIVHKRGEPSREWQIGTSNSAVTHNIELALFDKSTGGYVIFSGSTILANNVVYNVVVEYDGNQNCKIIINGIEDVVTRTYSGTYIAMENGTESFKIGSYSWGTPALGCQMDLDYLEIRTMQY